MIVLLYRHIKYFLIISFYPLCLTALTALLFEVKGQQISDISSFPIKISHPFLYESSHCFAPITIISKSPLQNNSTLIILQLNNLYYSIIQTFKLKNNASQHLYCLNIHLLIFFILNKIVNNHCYCR